MSLTARLRATIPLLLSVVAAAAVFLVALAVLAFWTQDGPAHPERNGTPPGPEQMPRAKGPGERRALDGGALNGGVLGGGELDAGRAHLASPPLQATRAFAQGALARGLARALEQQRLALEDCYAEARRADPSTSDDARARVEWRPAIGPSRVVLRRMTATPSPFFVRCFRRLVDGLQVAAGPADGGVAMPREAVRLEVTIRGSEHRVQVRPTP